LTVPSELLLPGVFIVVALGLDLLQYFIGTTIWFWYYRIKEMKGVAEDTELGRHSVWWEVPINFVFVVKVGFLGAAYVLILKFLLRTLSFT